MRKKNEFLLLWFIITEEHEKRELTKVLENVFES